MKVFGKGVWGKNLSSERFAPGKKFCLEISDETCAGWACGVDKKKGHIRMNVSL
jgi:hypothetical protein